jgi:exodeoxyribonuclease V gamma subunit
MSPPPHFHLISGNRLDALAAELGARLMRATDAAELLTPETVLVPQPALRQWLQHTLAERYGVAANLDLPTPSEFVWRLLRAASPTSLPEASPWDRERLRWRLYALLGRLAAKDAPSKDTPAALRRYLQRSANAAQVGQDGAAASIRFGLAERLAAAYDRYQAYRRDWLSAWERGEDRDDWQAVLWRSVCAEAATPHRAALIGDWLARYDRRVAGNRTPPPGVPARLAAFGTVHVSPDVLQMLAVTGQWCGVDFYLPTPSAEYWGDVESLRERLRRDGADALPAALADLQRDNPALTAWGGGGRDILAQVFSYETVQPQREVECFVDPGRGSVLRRLQQDVLQRAAPHAEAWSPGDVSVQIHACHSKLREVEVLHDRLRALLDDPRFEPPLQPREIAVMAPKFGGLDADDPRYIPFTLADRPQVQAHALIAWFLAVLELGDAPLRASGFRELLALPAAMQHLGLTAEDLARLDAWFAAAGIRWGEDAAARERAGVGRWREYSFDFGFERLLAGYAAGDDAGPWRTGVDEALLRQAQTDAAVEDERIDNPWIAPYAELEGGDAEVLDRALIVYARLRTLAAWMRAPHPAGDWRQRLSETVTALIGVHPHDSADAQARRWLLDALDGLAEDAAEADALPLAVVRDALQAQLTQASVHQPWLAGGVTFAGMVPLRTVPFRAICLLGLDADAYPRREPAQEVDRLVDAVQGRAPRRLGDRSVREDDRFLFLQLLCAAGDVFYLSYGGRDARDGSVREPAAPIVELLDMLERMDGGCETAADAQPRRLTEHVRFEHPLQPFSPRAFGGADGSRDARAFSYRGEWRVDAPPTEPALTASAPTRPVSMALMPPPPFVAAPLPPRDATARERETPPDRDTILGFFLNPAKAWLQTRLGLRFESAHDAFDNREPLGENELQKYQIVSALLRIEHERFESEAPAAQEPPQESAESQLQTELPQMLRARAALAPGRDGQSMLDEAQPLSQALSRSAREVLVSATQAPPERVFADAPIAFAFHDVRRDREGEPLRLIVEAGKLHGRRRLQAGLDHLLLASVFGETARTLLVGQGASKPKSSAKTAEHAADAPVEMLVFGGLAAASAAARIRRLLEFWREGEDAPLPFAPKAAWAYAEALTGKKPDPHAAWRAARDVFDYEKGGEAYDPHIALAFRPDGLFDRFDSPRAERFRALAVAVFVDLLPAMASTDADATAAANASTRARKTPAGRKP